MALNVQKSLRKYSSFDWKWDLNISEMWGKLWLWISPPSNQENDIHLLGLLMWQMYGDLVKKPFWRGRRSLLIPSWVSKLSLDKILFYTWGGSRRLRKTKWWADYWNSGGKIYTKACLFEEFLWSTCSPPSTLVESTFLQSEM